MKTKNLAHRGFSGRYPEDTMLAFRGAIGAGADGIELDVHLSRDGEVVVIHDETVGRTCGVPGRVQDLTAAELGALHASYLYRGQMGVNPVPTLREYFQLVRDLPILTNVELKTNVYEYPGLEEKVWDLIRACDLADRIIISSFNHFSVLRMRAIAPELKYGLLSESWLVEAGRSSFPANSQGVALWMCPSGPMTKMLMTPVSSTPAMPTPDIRSNFLETARERMP